MSASSAVISETLQAITHTKIEELQKQRLAYQKSSDVLLFTADESTNLEERLSILLDGISSLEKSVDDDVRDGLARDRRSVEQSLYDPSFPQEKLAKLEQRLRARLSKRERKLELAHIYSKLLVDWIQESGTVGGEDQDTASDVSFELVQDKQKAKLDQLRDRFAHAVFEPLCTDEGEIDKYLLGLFGHNEDHVTLRNMRCSVSDTCENLMSPHFSLDDATLRWCIKALIKEGLFNEEKKTTLRDFLKDEAVLAEIRDVLNMRYRDLDNWQWNAGKEGMPVVPRRGLNGMWRVMIDEDILQALLTHWIGVVWAVRIKKILKFSRHDSSLWKLGQECSDAHNAKRKYFLGASGTAQYKNSVDHARNEVYDDTFFLSPLPSTIFELAGGYDDDDEQEVNTASITHVKQVLLRSLATETLLYRALDGEVALVQSDFQWFATGISHATVFAVMRFVGFNKRWIKWFKKFLEPPLNMLDGKPVRTRKRGLPMSHIIEKLLGELVLYFMDLAVAQNNGMMLYRFHDDLYVVGPPTQCAASWSTMKTFASVMGLEFNQSKTGSVYFVEGDRQMDQQILQSLPAGQVMINFLQLDSETCSWTIDRDSVDDHIDRLRKQLSADDMSILQRIKTWNSCIGRFFGNSLGQPANCLGRQHLDSILHTHKAMQQSLFGDEDRSMHGYVRRLLQEQFTTSDIPVSFIAMPEELGGLEVTNPFIPLLLLRSDTCDAPLIRMRQFVVDERKEYEEARQKFQKMTERQRYERYKEVYGNDADNAMTPALLKWQDASIFMSYEEYTRHRERYSGKLRLTYDYLLRQPKESVIRPTYRIKQSLNALPYELETSNKILFWTLQSFEDELFEKYGGIEVVDKRLLPLGVMQALRAKRMIWNMVL